MHSNFICNMRILNINNIIHLDNNYEYHNKVSNLAFQNIKKHCSYVHILAAILILNQSCSEDIIKSINREIKNRVLSTSK